MASKVHREKVVKQVTCMCGLPRPPGQVGMKVRVILTVLVGVVTAAIVAACGSSNTAEDNDVPGYFNVTVVNVNGKKVTCITWDDDREGGLSCDWANAK